MDVLSEDQHLALSHILEWYQKDRQAMQYVTLGGYAGTGKTTLISILRKQLNALDPGLRVAFVSFTGKAARVLQTKIRESLSVYKKDTVGTIHSLIYTPVTNDREEIVGWKQKDTIDCDLIIIDEASMVDRTIWEHLVSYGKPMVVVGDHGQLPPIHGSFHLMKSPHITLSHIHRQAKQNPIIAVSEDARNLGSIATKRYARHVVKYDPDDPMTFETMQEMLSSYSVDTLILCGYNKTRKRLNTHIRQAKGFLSPNPQPGDRVICLRNNHKVKIYNGMLGTIQSIDRSSDHAYQAQIQLDGEESLYSGFIAVDQFDADTAVNYTERRALYMGMDLFDFGYALTVHKAQGSQAKKVILFEERFPQMTEDSWRRWLYTAVTRAEQELYIFPSR